MKDKERSTDFYRSCSSLKWPMPLSEMNFTNRIGPKMKQQKLGCPTWNIFVERFLTVKEMHYAFLKNAQKIIQWNVNDITRTRNCKFNLEVKNIIVRFSISIVYQVTLTIFLAQSSLQFALSKFYFKIFFYFEDHL